jgi:hypothetical protein
MMAGARACKQALDLARVGVQRRGAQLRGAGAQQQRKAAEHGRGLRAGAEHLPPRRWRQLASAPARAAAGRLLCIFNDRLRMLHTSAWCGAQARAPGCAGYSR